MSVVREIVLGIAVLVLGTVLLKYTDLPTRIAVVEAKTSDLGERLSSMDGKLDAILGKITQ